MLTNKDPMFYRVLLESIPVPIFYKGLDGRYVDCNAAFLSFVGKSKGEVIGKTVYDMAPKKIAEKYAQKDNELFAHPGTQVYEWKVQDKKGNVKSVIFHKATFNNEDGAVAGQIGVILDITDKKKAEQELQRKNEELERFNKLAIGRELRMIEFKKQVTELQEKLKIAQNGLKPRVARSTR